MTVRESATGVLRIASSEQTLKEQTKGYLKILKNPVNWEQFGAIL